MATEPARIQLRIWRVRKEMEQGALAERVGISKGHMNAIEKGKALPSLEVAARIEDLTGIASRAWSAVAPVNACEECGTQIADNSRMCDECMTSVEVNR